MMLKEVQRDADVGELYYHYGLKNTNKPMREIAKTFGVIKPKSWFVLNKDGYGSKTKSSEDNRRQLKWMVT